MNASEMHNHEHNRSTESDHSSVTENSRSLVVISDVSAQLGGDPEIIPLSQLSGLPVDRFEMDLLPANLQPWALDMQYRLQCPPDYIGVGIMVGLAAAVGNKVTIQPKAADHSWQVVPNLWGLLIGDPSAMKTPAMESALKPISRMEELLKEENIRLTVKDATIQSVQVIQSSNPSGILLVQDEISALFNKFDQPSSTDRQYLLEAFNGGSSYSVDRMSRESVFIEKNTLSLIGTIQPDVLKGIFQTNGSKSDGFMQRLQLAVWPDSIEQEYVDSLPDELAEREAWAVYTSLYQIEATLLQFSSSAQKVFENWMRQSFKQSAELGKDGLSELSSHVTKYRSMVPTIALLIELAQDQNAYEVSEASIVKAVQWSNYLITHAKRIYGIQDKAAIIAEKLVDKKTKLPKNFSPSEVVQKGWSGLTRTEDVKQGIDTLVKHRYLIPMSSSAGTKGGRPSERYRWNNQLE
jgi:hypothetical protein